MFGIKKKPTSRTFILLSACVKWKLSLQCSNINWIWLENSLHECRSRGFAVEKKKHNKKKLYYSLCCIKKGKTLSFFICVYICYLFVKNDDDDEMKLILLHFIYVHPLQKAQKSKFILKTYQMNATK